MSKPAVMAKFTAEGNESEGAFEGEAGAELGVEFQPGREAGISIGVDEEGNTTVSGEGDFTIVKKGDFRADLEPSVGFDSERGTWDFQGGVELVLSKSHKLSISGGSKAGDPYGKVALQVKSQILCSLPSAGVIPSRHSAAASSV